jgi:hypothetical protein
LPRKLEKTALQTHEACFLNEKATFSWIFIMLSLYFFPISCIRVYKNARASFLDVQHSERKCSAFPAAHSLFMAREFKRCCSSVVFGEGTCLIAGLVLTRQLLWICGGFCVAERLKFKGFEEKMVISNLTFGKSFEEKRFFG